ncbi:MAG TPA: hypothetical protein VFI61_00485 [Patescibacteria group bacterium]|nr:hypothetical protein [Patescibacteria group bacterium]
MRTFSHHLSHYLLLFGILLTGFAGLILFSYDRNFQIMVSVATAASYVSWGTVHHYIHGDLHLEVFIEYTVIAILGLVILFSLILV